MYTAVTQFVLRSGDQDLSHTKAFSRVGTTFSLHSLIGGEAFKGRWAQRDGALAVLLLPLPVASTYTFGDPRVSTLLHTYMKSI